MIRDVNERLGSEYFHQTLIIKKGARGHGHGSNLELNPRVREIHMSALSRSEEADQWVQKKLAPLALGEDMGDDCGTVLGEGASGKVYKRKVDGKDVAVKCYGDSTITSDGRPLDEFRCEAAEEPGMRSLIILF